MFFNYGDGSYYDALRDIHGEEEAFERYMQRCGKLIVATANENGATRLFMRSINPMTDLRKKNGWWNTFTVTKKPCDVGTYICKINEVRADKNGYPIFVVNTIIPLDEKTLACDELMYIFALSCMFVEEYHGWNSEYNHANFEQQVENISFVPYVAGVNHHIAVVQEAVRLFINGEITQEQIVSWLHEPTDCQKQEEAFKNEVLRFFEVGFEPENFPLVAEKCQKFKADHSFIWPESKVNFVKDLLLKYEVAVNAGHIEAVNGQSIWHQIEAYLAFDKARKEANKAAKAAAKKAKKAEAKANKQ